MEFPQTPLPSSARRAFSLLELIVVVAIIGIVATFAIPAFSTLNTAGSFNRAVASIGGSLERARAYAMANNLYVYVGIVEVNADQPETAKPQTLATATAGGRIAVVTVAARGGTRGYDLLASLPTPAWTNYQNGADFITVGPIEVFENVHLTSLGAPPTNGGMVRPAVSSTYVLGNPSSKSVTPLAWPLGSPLNAGQCQFYFEKVIQFDPQGVARMQYSTNQDNIVRGMEIGLRQTQGSRIPPASVDSNTGAVAALQIDGMTGSVRTYRP